MADTREEEARAARQGNARRGLARGAAMMAGLLALAVLFEAMLLYGFYSVEGSCDREAREVLEEFPQAEGAQASGPKEPVPATPASGRMKSAPPPSEDPTLGCQVSYQIRDSKEQAHEYYQEQLSVHGWTLVEPPPLEETDEPVLILARRDNVSYEVAAFALSTGPVEITTADETDLHLRVTVWESSEETP